MEQFQSPSSDSSRHVPGVLASDAFRTRNLKTTKVVFCDLYVRYRPVTYSNARVEDFYGVIRRVYSRRVDEPHVCLAVAPSDCFLSRPFGYR